MWKSLACGACANPDHEVSIEGERHGGIKAFRFECTQCGAVTVFRVESLIKQDYNDPEGKDSPGHVTTF